MYNKRRNNYSSRSNNSTNGYSSSRNGFSRRGFSGRNSRKQDKKLDSALFVNKARESKAEIHISGVTFTDFGLSEKLLRNITEHGYITPTQIQEKTIAPLLEGKDVIGIANTGTGKTAAFLIPLIEKISKDRNERVLIVTPTRELALQILDELKVFARGMDLYAALCIGGANIRRQENDLRHSPHFVIGTPGRLKDLIERRRLNLQQFQNIVLDEVDRMVDIGFIHDIKYLVSLLPKKRQSLFFSATVDGKTKEILHSFVQNPVTISVKQQETAQNIDQDVIRVKDRGQKLDVLHDLLIKDGFEKVLIFGQTKWGIEKLTKALVERGFKAAAIHGNKSQGQRQRALTQFKQNEVQVLLATDVASRGLDIDNVTHVINYDQPASYEDYVHRIGRTGRADKKGIALTFVE